MSRRGWTEIAGVEVDSPGAIARRALADADLRAAVLDAGEVARRVVRIVDDGGPGDAATRIARHAGLQREVEDATAALHDAVLAVIWRPRRRFRWLWAALGLAALIGVLAVLRRKGPQEVVAPEPATGAATRSER